ncbi:MAG: endonuclease/exonuclease/phosphatase family protein, partial [Flavobacterium sp.]|nr:endonuclease/exonuclease/phosphatase family protein [Flavobacterium sp.]
TGELQGKETIPTLHFQKKSIRTYHIDYIFGTKKFTDKIIKFEIGQFDRWIKISDHMPVFCEIE